MTQTMQDQSTMTILEKASPRPRSSDIFLESLPAELFERVAHYSSPEVLLDLRLTSRECALKVFRTYMRVHFTEIGIFIYSPYSMYIATKIARHKIFGPAIRTLNINISQPIGSEPVRQSELSKFLCMLRENCNVRRLQVLDHETALTEYPPRKCCLATSLQTTSTTLESDILGSTRMSILSAALRESRLALSEISIAPMRWAIDLDSWHHVKHYRGMNQMLKSNLKALRLLELSIAVADGGDPESIPMFIRLLEAASNLEYLSIRCVYDDIYEAEYPDDDNALEVISLAEALLATTFSKLRVLRLRGHDMEFRSLVNFVRRNATVTRLELENIGIVGDFTVLPQPGYRLMMPEDGWTLRNVLRVEELVTEGVLWDAVARHEVEGYVVETQ